MALLSNREDFDKSIMNRLNYATETQAATIKPTIGEVCQATGFTHPVSEADLKTFAQFCATWNIQTNVSLEKWFTDLAN